MDGYTRLQLGALSGADVEVVAHPGVSVLSLLAGSVGGLDHGVPARWQEAVRCALPPQAARFLNPLFAPGSVAVPDCLSLTSSWRSPRLADEVARVRDLPGDVLVDELGALFGDRVPAPWLPVARRPRAFLTGYADALDAAVRAFAPVWRRAEPLVERESLRIASVAPDLAPVLADPASRLRLDGSALLFPDNHPRVVARGARRLVLVPVIAGRSPSVFSIDRPDVVWCGYALPAIGALVTGAPMAPAPPDALGLVLGRVRATVLRATTGLPAGEVARIAACSPPTLSHHVALLEAAGLVQRVRSGRRVLLHRTARGDELVQLLSDPDVAQAADR